MKRKYCDRCGVDITKQDDRFISRVHAETMGSMAGVRDCDGENCVVRSEITIKVALIGQGNSTAKVPVCKTCKQEMLEAAVVANQQSKVMAMLLISHDGWKPEMEQVAPQIAVEEAAESAGSQRIDIL